MLAYATPCVYANRAGENQHDLGRSQLKRRTSAHRDTGAFFAPTVRVYGGCAWETVRSAGFRLSRFANLRTATPKHCLATVGDGSTSNGATPMPHLQSILTRSLKGRAAAHRAMAKSALFSDSSASVRLRKYNAHLEKARQLEARLAERLEVAS